MNLSIREISAGKMLLRGSNADGGPHVPMPRWISQFVVLHYGHEAVIVSSLDNGL